MKFDKQFFLDYVADFLLYDYLAHGVVLVLFFLLFLLFLASRKKILLGIFLFFLAVLVLVFGPFVAKMAIDYTARASKIEHLTYKPLRYIDNVIVKGSIANHGKIDFKECAVDVLIVKAEPNIYKQIQSDFKPIKKYRYIINERIKQKGSFEFNFVLTKFGYKDYKIKVGSKCK